MVESRKSKVGGWCVPLGWLGRWVVGSVQQAAGSSSWQHSVLSTQYSRKLRNVTSGDLLKSVCIEKLGALMNHIRSGILLGNI